MLRKIRITLAVVMLVGASLLFLDFTGTVHAWPGWIAEIQFIPAVLALNLGAAIALVLLTLVTRRLHNPFRCGLSFLMYMGTFDIFCF